MIIDSIKSLFLRDLHKLKIEIGLYASSDILWKADKEIKNSGGNLCYHLIGNLKHFIGHVLGKTGYIRKRELEFSIKNIPMERLVKEIGCQTSQVFKT